MKRPKQRKKRRVACPQWLFSGCARLLALLTPAEHIISPCNSFYVPLFTCRLSMRHLTSMIRHKARIAFARYTTSLPTAAVSFIILLVTMITSSAVCANSLMTKYTICRSEASLFWNNLDIPKKRDVASLVGNFSPVKRRSAILVSRIRHFRGDTGDVLKTRAVEICVNISGIHMGVCAPMLTFLKYARTVNLEDACVVLVLLVKTHDCGLVAPYRGNIKRGAYGNGREWCWLPWLQVRWCRRKMCPLRCQCLGGEVLRHLRRIYFDA